MVNSAFLRNSVGFRAIIVAMQQVPFPTPPCARGLGVALTLRSRFSDSQNFQKSVRRLPREREFAGYPPAPLRSGGEFLDACTARESRVGRYPPCPPLPSGREFVTQPWQPFEPRVRQDLEEQVLLPYAMHGRLAEPRPPARRRTSPLSQPLSARPRSHLHVHSTAFRRLMYKTQPGPAVRRSSSDPTDAHPSRPNQQDDRPSPRLE